MNARKIVGLVGLLVAVVGAFCTIPYAAAILVLIGLVVGTAIAPEDHVRVIVSALALASLSGVLTAIPAVGPYLAAILTNVSVITAGAALMIIVLNIYRRFKP
ncbi:MAG: hypothetical protein ABSE43_02605 [Steroidobacteraceae bacterium]|jgi:hypothetical protein